MLSAAPPRWGSLGRGRRSPVLESGAGYARDGGGPDHDAGDPGVHERHAGLPADPREGDTEISVFSPGDGEATRGAHRLPPDHGPRARSREAAGLPVHGEGLPAQGDARDGRGHPSRQARDDGGCDQAPGDSRASGGRPAGPAFQPVDRHAEGAHAGEGGERRVRSSRLGSWPSRSGRPCASWSRTGCWSRR